MRKIPITKLRNFYSFLSTLNFSTETQKCISDDFCRKTNFKKLIKLYNDSYNNLNSFYNNSNEDFFNSKTYTKRAPLSKFGTTVRKSYDIIAILNNMRNINIRNPNNKKQLDFVFINYEVSPLRTTKAIYQDGEKGSSSGTGGIDFIGYNNIQKIPILGEIKINGDKNPFYALIQLLTYLSELSIPSQIKRINKFNLFGNNVTLKNDTVFDLYILFYHSKKKKKYYDYILNNTKELANKIVGSKNIKNLNDIVFLEMNPTNQVISII